MYRNLLPFILRAGRQHPPAATPFAHPATASQLKTHTDALTKQGCNLLGMHIAMQRSQDRSFMDRFKHKGEPMADEPRNQPGH